MTMKNFTSVLCFVLLASVTVKAQEFKKFRLATGLGYAIPGGEGAGGGILYDFEPGYRVSDALCVSLRWEGAVVVRGLSASVNDYNASAAGIGSYTLNGIYYFSNNKFRPYAGFGVGIFNLSSVSSGSVDVAAESKIGFYPRLGFDLGHFNVNIDYNIVGPTEFTSGTTKYQTKNSYLGIRIGGFFFGGRK